MVEEGEQRVAEVVAINISEFRGMEKKGVKEVNVIAGWGLENDAHGGNWDRQVSIFPLEALEKVPKDKEEEVRGGGHTENFTISGIPLSELSVGALLKIGEAEIRILHIGKEERKENGRAYIISREGRFGRVVKGGKVRLGDEVQLVEEKSFY